MQKDFFFIQIWQTAKQNKVWLGCNKTCYKRKDYDQIKRLFMAQGQFESLAWNKSDIKLVFRTNLSLTSYSYLIINDNGAKPYLTFLPSRIEANVHPPWLLQHTSYMYN